MKKILFLLLLSAQVLARPGFWQGAYAAGRAIPIKGQCFVGQAQFNPQTDLRDCRQIRLRLNLTSQRQARFAIYVSLLDSQGQLLAAEGREEFAFARPPGWKFDHEIDLAIPDRSQAARYQITLIEEYP
jgi:hypothetical protein